MKLATEGYLAGDCGCLRLHALVASSANLARAAAFARPTMRHCTKERYAPSHIAHRREGKLWPLPPCSFEHGMLRSEFNMIPYPKMEVGLAKSGAPPRSNTVSIAGNVVNSGVASGDHNHLHIAAGTRSDEQAKVLDTLLEIRRVLADLSGPYADHARNTIDQAIDTADKGEPDKKSLGVLLDMTLQAAKKSAEFSSVAAALAPHLRHVVQWLGGEWGQLLTLI